VDVFVEGGGQTPEDIFEVLTRVVALSFGAFDEGVEDDSSATAAFAAGEHPIFTADGDDAQGAFGGVVVDDAVAIVEVTGECGPVILDVADGGHGGCQSSCRV